MKIILWALAAYVLVCLVRADAFIQPIIAIVAFCFALIGLFFLRLNSPRAGRINRRIR